MIEVILANKGFVVGFFVFLLDYHGTTWGHGHVAELLSVGAHLKNDMGDNFMEDNSLRILKFIVKWGLNRK